MTTSQDQTANAQVLDFNRDFSVRNLQQYTFLNNAWEVYVGRFVNDNQDGIFLYDRAAGQARVVSFNSKLQVAHFHDIQNLAGNWEVYSGDFNGSGRSQVLLYDPQAGQSTFVAFDRSLEITRQYQVASWDQRWQILVGAFVDRSRCLASGNCTTGDDILVLNRQTGQIQQYVFSFGRQYSVFDNRTQGFLRDGVAAEANLGPVDTTTFSLLGTLNTSIRGEELY